jgi:hypothetical protein
MSGEILIVSAVLLVALLPLIRRALGDGSVATRVVLLGGALCWLVLAVSLGQAMQRAEEAHVDAPGRPVEVRSDGYASSHSCQACHPDQYASWHASYHRTMTQPASPQSVRGAFDGRVLTDRYRYRLERQGDDFFVVTDDPQFGDDATAHRVVMVTGSHHQQQYWFETGRGRTVARLPFFWRIPDQRFVPSHAALLAQASNEVSEAGTWNRSCIRCHATYSLPRFGDLESYDTQVAELGIACESCHGPGEEHVRRHRDPVGRYLRHLGDEPDDTIVNPSRLTAQRSIDVCGRCHSVHAFRSLEDVASWSENGIPFRPGEDLAQAFHVFEVGQGEEHSAVAFMNEHFPDFFEDRFWPDGAVAIAGREYNGVRDSPCFASGEFTCTTCHALHPPARDVSQLAEWADDQLSLDGAGDAACVGCHPRIGQDVAAHSLHPEASAGSRCMNCHMPHTTYGLLKASRSHRVSSPDAATTLATGRPNACSLCHLDRSLAWTAAELQRGYGTRRPEISDPDRHSLAEGALFGLRGDAAQRALTAWHMGWAPSREASGSDWMVPILAQLLQDPYGAVRYIAHRSLRTIPGYAELEFDYLAPASERERVRTAVLARWSARAREPGQARAGVLLDAHGGSDAAQLVRLLTMRDDRRIYRAE